MRPAVATGRATSRRRSSSSCASEATRGVSRETVGAGVSRETLGRWAGRRARRDGRALMRWLLLKDLQILRRSPLLIALLVLYPIVIAVLIGLAISGGPDKPRVAFVNLAAARSGRDPARQPAVGRVEVRRRAVQVDRPRTREDPRRGAREGQV